MFTRSKLPLATMTALSIGLGAASATVHGADSKFSASTASPQASLSVQSSAEEAKLRLREEESKLIEWARKERERKAAEEEKLRLARRQRAQETVSGVQSACKIKPVMSDTEIEACRRAGR